MNRLVLEGATPEEMKKQLLQWYNALGGSAKRGNDRVLPDLPEVPSTDKMAEIIENEVESHVNDVKPSRTPIADSVIKQAARELVDVPTPFPDLSSVPAIGEHDVNERDSRGLPWDERINVSAKTKNKDGTWRYKRGLEGADSAIAAVENELKAKYGTVFNVPPSVTVAPAPVLAVVPPPPVPTVNVAMPIAPVVAPVAQPVAAPVVQSAPVYANIPIPAQVPQRPAYDFGSFKANFPQFMMQMINEGKIDRNYVMSLCQYFKVEEISEVLKDDVKTNEIFNTFAQAGFLTKVG